MSSYINLIQESEIQFRSAALDKKNLRMGILAAGSVLLLGLVFLLKNYFAITSRADDLKKQWTTLEPQYIKAKEVVDNIKLAQGRLSELKGWSEARMDLPVWMEQLAALVPAS
jgi:hypothetical protein